MKARLSEWIATGFGAGYLPIAPGTWGSAQACVVVLLIHILVPQLEMTLLWVFFIVSTVLGIWAANSVSRREGLKDPSKVVVDEIAGQFLALLFVPVSLVSIIIGFFAFRLLDIVKPFPARQSEQLPGGWGIVFDDLFAGAYAGLFLLGLGYFWPWML
jgi:phosphatidylglycerophosphatase A